MKNQIKAVITCAKILAGNTPQIEGTPSPEQVTEIYAIIDGLTKDLPGFKSCDYEYQDCSKAQDGSEMVHVFNAEFNGKPWFVYALHHDLAMAIVSFTLHLQPHNHGFIACEEVRNHRNEVVTDAFLSNMAIQHRTEYAA